MPVRKGVRAGRSFTKQNAGPRGPGTKKKTVPEVNNVLNHLMTKYDNNQNQHNVNPPSSAPLSLQRVHRCASISRLSLYRLNVLVQ